MGEQRYPVRGELDLVSASALQEQLSLLVDQSSDDLVLDCAGLDFIDSSGIAVFVHLQRVLELRGRGFRVEHLTGRARRVFDLLGLTDSLGIAPA
jgi:anti-sigma B factor antagonist